MRGGSVRAGRRHPVPHGLVAVLPLLTLLTLLGIAVAAPTAAAPPGQPRLVAADPGSECGPAWVAGWHGRPAAEIIDAPARFADEARATGTRIFLATITRRAIRCTARRRPSGSARP